MIVKRKTSQRRKYKSDMRVNSIIFKSMKKGKSQKQSFLLLKDKHIFKSKNKKIIEEIE
jgi:hypothetical protein